MPARPTRVRLFAGCALFALALGGLSALFPTIALAQQAGRVPVAAAARRAVAADLTRIASQDAPRGAL